MLFCYLLVYWENGGPGRDPLKRTFILCTPEHLKPEPRPEQLSHA